MNDAIFKFKRYEDSSLSYTGIDKHAGEDIGGWDTVIKRSEYEALFYNLGVNPKFTILSLLTFLMNFVSLAMSAKRFLWQMVEKRKSVNN